MKNFWGLWNLSSQISLAQATQLAVQRNRLCFGSNTTDANICTVKQVDLGASFPAKDQVGRYQLIGLILHYIGI